MKLVYPLLVLALLPASSPAQTDVPRPAAPVEPLRQRVRTITAAESGQAVSENLDGNYQVNLTFSDKDGTSMEISVVTALRTFSTSLGEYPLTLAGTLSVQADGTVLCAYTMQWAHPAAEGNAAGAIPGMVSQSKNSTVQGSARVTPGKDVEIFRAGTRSAKLSVKKLDAPDGH